MMPSCNDIVIPEITMAFHHGSTYYAMSCPTSAAGWDKDTGADARHLPRRPSPVSAAKLADDT